MPVPPPLTGLRRALALAWLLAVVALHLAVREAGLVLVR